MGQVLWKLLKRIVGEVLSMWTSLLHSYVASFPGSTAQRFLQFGKTRVFPNCKKCWAVEPRNEAIVMLVCLLVIVCTAALELSGRNPFECN